MKRFVQISLVLNVVLLAAVGWVGRHETHARPLRGEALGPAPKPVGSPRSSPAAQLPRSKAWNFISRADPQEFIANLRTIGCPEQTIRDIVVLKVCREFRDRLMALETEAASAWDYTRQQSRDYWRERNAQRQDLRDEMISKLESLFGQSWLTLTASLRGGPEWGRDPLASLSIEGRRQIRDVERQYRRELEELQQKKWTGELDTADTARIREMERDKRAALAGILSPQEMEEYRYRQSSAADYVRRNLPQAKSEAEFRSIVKLALELEMSEATSGLPVRVGLDLPDDAKREAEQRKAEFDRRLKELLGDTRLAEQQAEEQAREAAVTQERKAQDELRFLQELSALAAEVGVSAEDVSRFYRRLKELEPTLDSRFKELERNFTGTAQEKQKQMEAAIKAEMERIAVELMGEKGPAFIEKIEKKQRE